MSNFTQQLMGRRHTKVDNTRNTLYIIMAVQSSLCKSGTCAPFNASHSNHTKFKYSTENVIGVMSRGVLNWSVRPGSHAVHCHVQFVYKHAVWRLRYGLPDDFSYTKLNLFIFLSMIEQIFTKLSHRVHMYIKNSHKQFQLDRIHRDREIMQFSCVKFDILIFTIDVISRIMYT